ncbi:hypothetical protein PV326_007675 [Microctonus aethiopoides]|nr:hypothetical protein PV326_007675 [Microctonus aethiopoides]
MDIRQLPASVIMETTEYKCFQSRFSVLCNESMQLKTQFDDARQQWQSSKNSYLRDIEMMEIEELMAQEIKLRGECIQLEDVVKEELSDFLSGSLQIKDETGISLKREMATDEEMDRIEVNKGENKVFPDGHHTQPSPTLKKEKEMKRGKDMKKEYGIKSVQLTKLLILIDKKLC